MTITDWIIKKWFQKWETENKDNYDKFIYLWISFNAYYSKLCILEFWKEHKYKKFLCENEKRDWDWSRIDFFIKFNDDSWKEFLDKEKDEIKKFHEYIKKRQIPNSKDKWWVKNLQRWNIKKYKKYNNFNEFIYIIYQVRNNLFHWGKDYWVDSDNKLVEKTSIIFEKFLKYIIPW